MTAPMIAPMTAPMTAPTTALTAAVMNRQESGFNLKFNLMVLKNFHFFFRHLSSSNRFLLGKYLKIVTRYWYFLR
jgi:hypothetical protein